MQNFGSWVFQSSAKKFPNSSTSSSTQEEDYLHVQNIWWRKISRLGLQSLSDIN